MKKIFTVIIILFIGVSCKTSLGLFEENESNWIERGNAKWEFKNSELVGSVVEDAGFITTKEYFDNFVLECEFKPDSTINSGVFLRCENDPINAGNCYEINIWDGNPNPNYRTGGVVNTSARMANVETINKWNTYKIKCENNYLQAWVNGILTANFKDESHVGGYIGLQAQGTGVIIFRNVKISKLK